MYVAFEASSEDCSRCVSEEEKKKSVIIPLSTYLDRQTDGQAKPGRVRILPLSLQAWGGLGLSLSLEL